MTDPQGVPGASATRSGVVFGQTACLLRDLKDMTLTRAVAAAGITLANR